MTATGTASVPKALSIFTMVVAVLLLILFGMDIAAGIPFGRAGTVTDVIFIVIAVLLGYLGWSTWREQLR